MIETVERARITVLVENHVDMLLTNSEDVRRFGIMDHFVPPYGDPVCAENGLAFWIELQRRERRYRVLFDAGLTSHVILHNLRALGLSPDQLDHAALSHGHPDHFGGLVRVLQARREALPIAIHPDAFLPKYLVDEGGDLIFKVNRGLDRMTLEEAGAVVIDSREPTEIGPGAIVTGEIERTTSFEPQIPESTGGRAGLFVEREGVLLDDASPLDDQAVVLNVLGKGLVVITACGHAGVINSIRQAQRITGVEQVYAVFGGFHTGFPGVPPEAADKTVDALRELQPTIVAPMHCSGLGAVALCLRDFPDGFLQAVVGTTVII